MQPLLDRRHGLARPVDDHGVGPGVTPPRGFRVVRSGSRTGLSTSITARHATGIEGGAAIPVGELHRETERCAVKIDGRATLAPGAAPGSSGRGGRLSDSSSGDHPTADQRRLPSRAGRRTPRGPRLRVQNRLSPGDSGLIGLDVQRSEVASRPGNGRVRPVVIADIDHDRDGLRPVSRSSFRRGWPCSDLSRASRGSRLRVWWLSARAKLRPQTVRFQYSIRRRFLRTRYQSR